MSQVRKKLSVGEKVQYENEPGRKVTGTITELGVTDDIQWFSTFARIQLEDGSELVVFNREQERLQRIPKLKALQND